MIYQNKIRVEHAAGPHGDIYWTDINRNGLRSTSYPIEESSEESGCCDKLNELLSDGAKIADDTTGKTDDRHQAGSHLKRKSSPANAENRPPPLVGLTESRQTLRQALPKKNTTSGEGSVFKSANWLSDSELIFSLSNQVGGLVRALRIFQELDIGIKHVESRKSKRRESEFEIFVDIDCSDPEKMRKLVHHLR